MDTFAGYFLCAFVGLWGVWMIIIGVLEAAEGTLY